MSIEYFTHALGIIHLIRFLGLIGFLTLAEMKLSSCQSSLNEFLGFNHQSILFYYILIWISFAFEIYFLINRLLASIQPRARKSLLILYSFQSLAFALASAFTLYAILHSSHGHVITQHDFDDPSKRIILITPDCNLLRLIGILFGLLISMLYLIAVIVLSREQT